MSLKFKKLKCDKSHWSTKDLNVDIPGDTGQIWPG